MLDILGTPAEQTTVGQIIDSIMRKDLGIDGQYYRGFPILASSDGPISLDALLCSKQYGVAIIHTVEGRVLDEDFADHVDEVHLKLCSKLSELKELTRARSLAVPVISVTFAPSVPEHEYAEIAEDIGLCRTEDDLLAAIKSETLPDASMYEPTLSRLQSLSSLKSRKKRTYVKKSDSRGAVLKKLESKLATLDVSQTRAVLERVDGVQRIRGLAGSGKTVVLARKVAHLHSQNPDWRIAITFNSRSLKEQFKYLIKQFYFDANGEFPDLESKVNIIHAWGAPRSTGLYYEACVRNNITYMDFNEARNASSYNEAFSYACQSFLNQASEIQPLYDLILVDEAQDFSTSFLKLCYEILPTPKRLVYAYDELQNLGDSSMPSTEEIWGLDELGKPVVEFTSKSQDLILDICYRTPGPILSAAHALGFGIYRKQMIQMFDYADLWGEIGYEVTDGKLSEGNSVTLKRSEHSSPTILTGYNSIEELIQLNKFSSDEEQAYWIAEQIAKNIAEDEILPSDIVVIHPNAMKMRNEVGLLRNILFSKGINSSIAGVTASPDEFFSDDSVTFTSIYRAKGNEASIVYIMNAEYCNTDYELSKKRNILFTAMTRTKAWLRVCGVGSYFDGLLEEYNRVIENDFSLHFTYPTEAEREKMRVVNRDMSSSERQRVNAAKRNAQNLAILLDGEVNVEDIPEELRAALLAKLRGSL
ncbi:MULTISPECIES: DEAD/DEAH box helicase [Vibrio]|uniref:DEAD/DEAH box helicase n=1 Tax=Vibrio TaxID=662 RepID=UPI00115839DB|nr:MULTISPECIES: ATP-binding domain-containing protein [Vibrio]TQP72944.1 AAA family ATPase [Vibrio cholerae]HDZ9270598.1 DEAD/DEAH box helicase [Vibrio cholerae]